mmetsp:Transcript_16426/g.24755  ORF Transcript_16426/g.24755 Transcript_16426/m.24755 type:complete len:178 (-) Transcript_16426:85-618(-)
MEFFNFVPGLNETYRMTGWTPPYVTAVPEITTRNLNSTCKFLVLGCDGLFSDLTSQEVVDSVEEYLRTPLEKRKGQNAAAWLTEKAMAAAADTHVYGPRKNIDVLKSLLRLPQGRTRRRYHDDITVQVLFFDHEANFPPQDPSFQGIQKPKVLRFLQPQHISHPPPATTGNNIASKL